MSIVQVQLFSVLSLLFRIFSYFLTKSQTFLFLIDFRTRFLKLFLIIHLNLFNTLRFFHLWSEGCTPNPYLIITLTSLTLLRCCSIQESRVFCRKIRCLESLYKPLAPRPDPYLKIILNHLEFSHFCRDFHFPNPWHSF